MFWSRIKLLALVLLPALLSTGCSTLNTHFEPKTDVGQLKHVFVVESLNDNHDLHDMIVRDLQARGLQAESGPLTLMPASAKAYVVYEDHWEWDFKNSLISLTITLRDARSDRLLANATYYRPTAFLKTPEYMVQSVLDGLFKPGAKSTPSPAISPPTEDSRKRGR
jgi:hypothetical protein